MIYRFLERPLVEDKPQAPSTLNTEERSVDIIISTDQPIVEYDLRTDSFIPTVIIPEGIEIPKNRQVPLLDCHDRSSTDNQIGSVRNMRVENNGLVGTAYFAKDTKSERVFTLVQGGHLTDYSIGASIREVAYLEEGEVEEIHGRKYQGPLKLITKSGVMEVSSCPIGADDNAKNRSKQEIEERQNMSEIERKEEAPVEAPVERTVEVDTEAISREAAEQAVKAERARVAEVEGLCRDLGMDEKFQEEVKDLDLDSVKERALKVIAEQNKVVNVNKPHIQVVDAADKYRAGIADAFALRTGLLGKEVSAERKEIAREMAGYTLTEVCREFLKQSGHNYRGNQMEIIGRALSTSDFSNVLGNLGHKSLLESFDKADETYSIWCDTSGSLSNFQVHSKVRAGELGDMTQIAEGESVRYGSRTDQKETISLDTYAQGYKLTRQAIINDDLSELTDAFAEMGEAVQRLYGDTAYNILTLNGNMGDGNPLFDAAHSNLGTQGIISETTIGEAIKLMKLQKDIGGKRRLNIRPQYLLSSVKNEAEAEVFFNSQMFQSADTAGTRANIYSGRFERIYEPRLDDYDNGDPWFLLGAKGKTVKMFFLNGQSAPFMEQEKDFDTDCVKWKVRADVAAMAVRWEGMVKNTGA